MDQEIKADNAQTGRAVASKDLSLDIERSMERERGEEVRSVWVYEDYYRCNWWARHPSTGPSYLNGRRITRSKFLRAIMTGEKLVIEDVSRGRTRDRS